MGAETQDLELVKEFRNIITEHETTITKEFVTKAEGEASYKKTEARMVELFTTHEQKLAEKFAASETKFSEKFTEQATANERLVKQLSARGVGGAPNGNVDIDARTVGERFIESAEYKAWATSERSKGARLQLSIKGRIREQKVASTITEPGSGYPILPHRVGTFAPPTLPLVMRDLLPVVSISGTNAIEYVLETWNYAADYQILEGDKKAQGDVTYLDKTAMVRTIAWFIKVSRQMLSDAPYFASTIDSQLLYGVAKKEDHELLHGDGAAGHILGILPQATALPVDFITGILFSADQIASAIAYLRSFGYSPTGIVMNPIDWASMQIAKTTQGVYILGGPPVSYATATLWGLPVVSTYEMTKGTFMVGAFPPNCTLFDRESASVDVAYENEDDFVRNLVTMRCEERIALAVYRPQGFVKGPVVHTLLGAEMAGPGDKKNAK